MKKQIAIEGWVNINPENSHRGNVLFISKEAAESYCPDTYVTMYFSAVAEIPVQEPKREVTPSMIDEICSKYVGGPGRMSYQAYIKLELFGDT